MQNYENLKMDVTIKLQFILERKIDVNLEQLFAKNINELRTGEIF